MANTKVVELNLEYGSPDILTATARMKNALVTCKGQGYKAVIVIHGYGSTGVGGGIKTAIRRSLTDPGLRGIVRMFVGGEDWAMNKRPILDICGSLSGYERKIAYNNGVTVVILR